MDKFLFLVKLNETGCCSIPSKDLLILKKRARLKTVLFDEKIPNSVQFWKSCQKAQSPFHHSLRTMHVSMRIKTHKANVQYLSVPVG